jgi:hypothetical protein
LSPFEESYSDGPPEFWLKSHSFTKEIFCMSVTPYFSRRTRAALAIVFTLLFALSTAAAAFASGGGITEISSDPYTNTSSQHKTQVEPDTYSSGSTIVSAFQSGRFFDGGASNIGWATSTDNGTTWKHGFLPGTTVFATPKGKYARASDPAVAFDAKDNVWIITWLGLMGAGVPPVDVLASRSTNGGLTWTNPVTVAATGQFYDKSWSVCDDTPTSTFYGHCYAEFDNFSNSNLVQMTTSTDGGKTWGAVKTTPNHACVIGGQPLVQPNGTVIVPIDDCFESSVLAFRSTDGGNTWSSTVTVATINSHPVAGGLRSPDLPSAEIDKSGKVYVVFYDCRFESGCSANDIVLTTSTNGITWSPVKRIPSNPVGSGVDHFIPGIAVDKSTSGATAHLVVTYYYYPAANCSSSTCQLDVGYSSSVNGGSSWAANRQLAGPITLSWLANTNQGTMVGDYISTSFGSNAQAYGVFANATAPSGGKFNEFMVATTGLVVLGGSASSDHDPVLSSHPTLLIRQTSN